MNTILHRDFSASRFGMIRGPIKLAVVYPVILATTVLITPDWSIGLNLATLASLAIAYHSLALLGSVVFKMVK